MKKKILILSGLFIFFVVILAPANLLEKFFPQQNQISIAGLKGSIWSGKINQLSVKGLQFNDVSFSINPVALFFATLSIDLELPTGDISGSLNLSLDSNYSNAITLSNVNLRVNTERLQNYLPIEGVELLGNIIISELMLTIRNRKTVEMAGQVSWRKAAINFAGQSWFLGDFIINTQTNKTKKEIVGLFEKTNNKLGLEGKIILSENGMLEFVGSIATNIDQDLYSAIALFNDGKPANGRLPIRYKQSMF